MFDVLSIDGRDVIGRPYEERRQLLTDLVEAGQNWAVPAHRVGGGAELLAATGERQLEGVMAKRLGTTYRPGKRTKEWRKVKHRRRPRWSSAATPPAPATGRRASAPCSSAAGWTTGRWRSPAASAPASRSAGWTSSTPRLKALRTAECPFTPPPPTAYRRGATWVQPVLAAIVEITEFTNEGYVRQASFIDLVDLIRVLERIRVPEVGFPHL